MRKGLKCGYNTEETFGCGCAGALTVCQVEPEIRNLWNPIRRLCKHNEEDRIIIVLDTVRILIYHVLNPWRIVGGFVSLNFVIFIAGMGHNNYKITITGSKKLWVWFQ